MRRRRFIVLSVGAAGSWLLAARAQQTTGTRRVAFLHPYVENDTEVLGRVIAFREGLEALGWTAIFVLSIDILAETWAEFEPTQRNWCIRHRTSSSEAGRQSPQH